MRHGSFTTFPLPVIESGTLQDLSVVSFLTQLADEGPSVFDLAHGLVCLALLLEHEGKSDLDGQLVVDVSSTVFWEPKGVMLTELTFDRWPRPTA
jgi:hypothetical protein